MQDGEFSDAGSRLEGQEFESWLRKHHIALSKGEQSTLAYYVDLGFRSINADLRSLITPVSSVQRKITILSSAIGRQCPLQRSAVVWRGIKGPSPFDSIMPGEFMYEPAFSSASVFRDKATFFAEKYLLRIVLPARTSGLYVPATGVKADEKEILLPAGIVYEIHRIADNVIEVIAHEPNE